MNQIPLIEMPVCEARENPVPDADIWLVIAWAAVGNYWKVCRDTAFDEHDTLEEAMRHAESLPSLWTHRHILHAHVSGGRTA